ncbi:hypothetical protein [Alteraurantiacibacter buctensis]|uniref:Uncharacterized protein n=1 Tax=Alteraurantiacibacter buctensis TaxID=1503981 RepID=A0A844Z036_9SPHN|nr:hypothetical protein [Alteraurantiacibacter buctensis]MXO72074.1 hypothetical protein [Alteraurantiacibacter buctensis]
MEADMTLERENQLVCELQRIDSRKRELIRQIVEATLAGKPDNQAAMELDRLSRLKGNLTRPSLSVAA